MSKIFFILFGGGGGGGGGGSLVPVRKNVLGTRLRTLN